MEENKLSSSDSEGSNVKPAESGENVSGDSPSEESKKSEEYYKELTGRNDIKTKEDFDKHYEGLKNLVGDQKIVEIRKKAEAHDKMLKDAGEDIDKFTKTDDGKKVIEGVKEDEKKDEIKGMKAQMAEERFIRKHPELESYVELVQAVAGEKGLDLESAYKNHLEDLIASKIESDKSKNDEKNSSVNSKSRLSSSKGRNLEQLSKDALEHPSDDTQHKLVEEFFSETEEK